MNTRQLTLVVTVAAIALVFVGIGFAYTAYTVNNGNQTEVAYVTVTMANAGDATPYTFADGITVQFDTYNEDNTSKIYYKVKNPVNLTNGTTTYDAYKLGSIKLHAVFNHEGNGTATAPSNLAVNINSSENFDAGNKWMYFLTYAPTNANEVLIAYKDTAAATKTWTTVSNELKFTLSNSAYADLDVNVYYGYSEADTITIGTEKFLNNYGGEPASSKAPKALTGASIVFTATDDFQIIYKSGEGSGDDFIQVPTESSVTLATFDNTGFTAPNNKTFAGWKLYSNGAATGNVISNVNITNSNIIVIATYSE